MEKPDRQNWKWVRTDSIRPNEWNPNEESDEKFNMLCKSIDEDGFLEPVQVHEIEEDDYDYEIVHGEHKHRAAEVLGIEEVPIIELNDYDEDRRKFLTVRMNVIEGELNPMKLTEMIESLDQKYEDEVLKEMMGFTDEDVIEQVLDDIKGNVPEEVEEGLEEVKDEIETIDDLSSVLNKLFREYGDTIDENFMFFTHGGEKHIMVQVNDEVWDKVKSVAEACGEEQLDINRVFEDYFNREDIEESLDNVLD